MEDIQSVKDLDNIIKNNKADPSWGRLLGFYYKVKEGRSEDIIEHMTTLISLHKSLHKKGYKLSKEVIIALLDC